jgi:AraC-like DNA-binding protein
MNATTMPDGVTLASRPIKGKRVIVKNRRQHANQQLHIAEWPEANLHEITVPKLAYIVSGKADYLLGKYCAHCEKGSILLLPPRIPHQCRGPFLQNDNLVDGYCELMHTYAYSHGVVLWWSHSRNGRHFNEYADEYLFPNITAVKILNLLMEEAIEGKESFETVGRGLLSSLFTILAQDIADERYTPSSPTVSLKSPAHDSNNFSDLVREYLASNCHKPLKLDDVAAQMYMSVSQFTRKLRQETGTTFVELLIAARIERAKQMLRETDWTSTAIASFVSFKSPNYFGELFRRRVGYTPAQYRRLITQNMQGNDNTKIDRISVPLTK